MVLRCRARRTSPAAGMRRSPTPSTTGTATRTGPTRSGATGKRKSNASGGLGQDARSSRLRHSLLGLEPLEQRSPIGEILSHQMMLHLVDAQTLLGGAHVILRVA